MKELSLLFPTILNFSIFDTKKGCINPFENTWANIGPVCSPCTRGIDFWCGKVIEGDQVTFSTHFENVILVRLKSSHPHQKCRFEQ